MKINWFKMFLFYPTGHEAQDSNGFPIRKSQEEASEKIVSSPSAGNRGCVQVNTVAALRENPRAGETSETEKPDKDFKTTICNKSIVSGKFCS